MKDSFRNASHDKPGWRYAIKRSPRPIIWTSVILLLAIATLAGWLGMQVIKAKSNLEQAKASAAQAKDSLLGGNADDATRSAEVAAFHANAARAETHSLPWKLAAAVPFAGSPLRTSQQISDVVAGLANELLLPAARTATAISPDKLVKGNRIDLGLLRDQETRLTELSSAALRLDAAAQAISRPTYLSPVRDARLQLQDQTARLSGLLVNAALAAKLAPAMLGADGPRSYLMGFQTNAEARGTGGLLGGFGVLRFDGGIPKVDALASNTELDTASARIDLGPEFDKVYGWTNPYTDFRNSNLSPHFPYAAQIWKSMWEGQSGEKVDGVIAIDPVALSYVLGAVGPATLPDGETVTAENVVELTESTAYIRFPSDQPARKRFLQQIASTVVQKVTGSLPSPRKLLDALGRAASERRIAVWSADPADQSVLEESPLAHIVPDDDPPYAQVVLNNLAGNKMDYYLKREIEYAADGCNGEMRNSTVTVKLTNTATDRPLPDYVAGSLGLLNGLPLNVPRGTMVTSVRLVSTKGSRLMSVTSRGERTSAIIHQERGRPSYEVQVAIPPGQSGELTFRLSEPTASGDPRVPVQPLIDDVTPLVEVPACS